eukprot:15352436-Ditylum_brightwellii.AAC.1
MANNGLAVGAYESAILADICVIYFFEIAHATFCKKYKGAYQDDSIVMFEGKLNCLNIAN